MAKSLGGAVHRFSDGSEHVLRVEIEKKGAPGYPAAIGEPSYFTPRQLDGSKSVCVGGARQARALASLLRDLADRLEARGEL